MLFLSCSVVSVVNAQFHFGVKAGVNISTEKYSNTAVYSTSSHNFLVAGLMARYQIKNKIGLESGLYYSTEGTDEKYKSGSNTVTGVVKISRLNLPMLVQLKLGSGIYAETGPQAGFLISAKGKYTTGVYDFKEATKPFLASWVFGAGFEPGKIAEGLGVNLIFAKGLNPINSRTVNGGKITASTISLRVFYLLRAHQHKK